MRVIKNIYTYMLSSRYRKTLFWVGERDIMECAEYFSRTYLPEIKWLIDSGENG